MKCEIKLVVVVACAKHSQLSPGHVLTNGRRQSKFNLLYLFTWSRAFCLFANFFFIPLVTFFLFTVCLRACFFFFFFSDNRYFKRGPDFSR